jgi:cardiolipin synthase
MPDPKLTAALKAARSKPLAFAFVVNGSTDGALLVNKKISPAEVVQAKSDLGGTGKIIKGRVFWEDGLLVFGVAKEQSATAAKVLKTVLKTEAGLNPQFEFRVMANAEDIEDAEHGQAHGDPKVADLQTSLKAQGYDPGQVDGIIGPQTLGAVKQFQQAHGLTPDGIVGPKTRAALDAARPNALAAQPAPTPTPLAAEPSTSAAPAPAPPRAALPGDPGIPVRPGTKVDVLINGEKAFPKMYQAIDNATSSVNYTVFEFDSDSTGREMAKHLVDAAARGVKVRLIYDPVGSKAANKAIFDYLRKGGVQVIAQKPGFLDDHLTHRKILVTDGKTGFTGGMNVGDNYHGVGATPWHDVHAQITGPGVADLQGLFVDQWKADGGDIESHDYGAMFPELQPIAGAGDVKVIGHKGLKDEKMKTAYLQAIDTAKSSIHIASPYFTDQDVINHLIDAAHRGVKVMIVLPATNDEAIVQDAERAEYNKLIDGGVNLYEYHGRSMAHEKVATFDGQVSTIGSSNLDARSLNNNDEANVWTNDPTVAANLDEDLFAVDINESTQITSHKPGFAERLKEGFAHTIAKLL